MSGWDLIFYILLNLNITVIECISQGSEGVRLASTHEEITKSNTSILKKGVKQHGFICLSDFTATQEHLILDFEAPCCFVVLWCWGLQVWSLNRAAWKTCYPGQPGRDRGYYAIFQKETLTSVCLLLSSSHYTYKT